jgi:hypothetical protein
MSFIEYLERGKDILNPSVIYFEKERTRMWIGSCNAIYRFL